jgi:hypothetical protein
MRHNFISKSLNLNKVKEREHEDPNEVHKVPVKTNFFNHFIMTPSIVNTHHSVVINHEVETNTTEHVKSMESGNEEKESSEIRRPILIMHQ